MLPVIGRDGPLAIGVKGQVVRALRQDTLDDGSNSIRRCLHLAGCFMKGVRSRPQTINENVINRVLSSFLLFFFFGFDVKGGPVGR